ncbi:MAG: ABC transporter substrate-binding protein [Firmicutes bacterium]|jgi:NitT/TauT family transport system substrate-binding protein|nr:ABC transporter substrate-binding protein [Bacillota bacterium]
MSKQGWITIICLAVAVALLLGSIADAQELERVTFTEVVRSVFYAPQYVALELGFFADEGLDVRMETAWGADKGAAALISGSVDIGFFGPEAAIYIYQQGSPETIVGFAQLTARDGSFFMTRDLDEDFTWDNVRGKTIIGARPGGVPQMVLEWVLKKHGIEPFVDVEIMTNFAFEAALGAFQAGVGDYIAQFEPAMSQIELMGGGKVVASLGAEAGPIAYTVYHARKSTLRDRPEMLIKFTRAIYRGQLWVAEHSAEEIAAVVAPFFPEIADDVLINTINNYKSINAWQQTPIISEEAFRHLQEVMFEAGELYEFVPFDELMDNSIAEAVVGS